MPTIKYPDGSSEPTVFVTTDEGKRTRAVATASVEGEIIFPNNQNSAKGHVIVNGVKRRVVLTANIAGGGGGDQHNLGWYATQSALETAHPTAEDGDWAIVGETDTVWVWDSDSTSWKDTDSKAEVTPDMVIIKAKVMPAASSTPADAMYQYTGATNATYTTNYIYRNIKTATYTGTVSFEPATLSGTTVACSGDNFANFLTESGVEPLSVVSGTMTFDSAGELWVLVGKDSGGNTVLTFQEYQQDFVDAGFTFTGTPQNGDVVAFTCTVEEASATYVWTRVDVQPAGIADYNALSNKPAIDGITLTNASTKSSLGLSGVTFRTWGANE